MNPFLSRQHYYRSIFFNLSSEHYIRINGELPVAICATRVRSSVSVSITRGRVTQQHAGATPAGARTESPFLQKPNPWRASLSPLSRPRPRQRLTAFCKALLQSRLAARELGQWVHSAIEGPWKSRFVVGLGWNLVPCCDWLDCQQQPGL